MLTLETIADQGTYIGAGIHRTAYLYDGYVYKIGAPRDNTDEYNTYLAMQDNLEHVPDDVAFPEMSLEYIADSTGRKFATIKAEYIKGEHPTYIPSRVAEAGVHDIHSDNVIIKDGMYYIIDLGAGSFL